MANDASGLRPGELAVDLPEPGDARLRYIGRIRTPWARREDCPRQGKPDGPDCFVEIFEPWAAALSGIEDYERIDLLYWLDRSRRDLVLQSPKHNGRTTGTFALRSPVRPNPIGLAKVVLVAVKGSTLRVRGLDCLDGTPLIDVKPDRCAFSPVAPPKPGVES